MESPPNIQPIDLVLKTSQWYHEEDLYSLLVCPVCSSSFNHLGEPVKKDGLDGYQAWRGRGDLVIVPLSGECGSEWEICFGFHKGESNAFVRVRRSCVEKSCLYFIEAVGTGFVKSGRSADPEKRVAQLAIGSPNELVILGKISGGLGLERELHARFGKLRQRGEWFRVNEDLRRFIMEATA